MAEECRSNRQTRYDNGIATVHNALEPRIGRDHAAGGNVPAATRQSLAKILRKGIADE